MLDGNEFIESCFEFSRSKYIYEAKLPVKAQRIAA